DVGLGAVAHPVEAGERPARPVDAVAALAVGADVARAVQRARAAAPPAVDVGLAAVVDLVVAPGIQVEHAAEEQRGDGGRARGPRDQAAARHPVPTINPTSERTTGSRPSPSTACCCSRARAACGGPARWLGAPSSR